MIRKEEGNKQKVKEEAGQVAERERKKKRPNEPHTDLTG